MDWFLDPTNKCWSHEWEGTAVYMNPNFKEKSAPKKNKKKKTSLNSGAEEDKSEGNRMINEHQADGNGEKNPNLNSGDDRNNPNLNSGEADNVSSNKGDGANKYKDKKRLSIKSSVWLADRLEAILIY